MENKEMLLRQQEIIRQSRKQIEALSARIDQPIAIVGMACRMPGADSPAALWDLMMEGCEAISEVPADRWNIEDYYASTPATPFKTNARQAGYISGVDLFDAKFFGISPREAQQMDPQQRLLLEVSYQALEHACLPVTALRGQPVGVFIGISSSEYAVLTFGKGREASPDAWSITGTSTNAAAGRLAYYYGFNGPALAIDTACSSSLAAIYQACRSLVNQECHTALAGGVNCLLTPEPGIALAQNKVLSPSGHCSPFSAQADGLVRGEGCGVLVLKRLSDALAENCPILAVIRSGHINQDGASSGLTVPNGYAQQALVAEALTKARLAPAAIRYVEAHGTGTLLGDPIEVKALQQALCVGQNRVSPLLIGSIKAHIGHLEAASGVAGVIKVVLALQHRLLPAQVNLSEPTKEVDWTGGELSVVARATPLEFGFDKPYYAGVSSFGFSGTNAHLILQDAVSATAGHAEGEPTLTATPSMMQFLGISAKDPVALKTLLASYLEFFRRHADLDWLQACETLNAGRSHYSCRAGFVAKNRDELLEQLAEACRSEHAGSTTGKPALANEQLINKAKMLVGAPTATWQSLLQPHEDLAAIVETIRDLYLAGVPLKWPQRRRTNDLLTQFPGYPFRRESYWLPDVPWGGAPRSGKNSDGRDYAIDWIDVPVIGSAATLQPGEWLLVTQDGEQDNEFEKLLSQYLEQDGIIVQMVPLKHITDDLTRFNAVIYCVADSVDAPTPSTMLDFLLLVERVLRSSGPPLYCVVASGKESYRPLASGFAGLCRSLHEEEADLCLTLVGLDDGLNAKQRAEALLREIRAERGTDWERRVAVDRTMVPRLVERGPSVSASIDTIRADRSYLITGGTGALGQLFAQALIELGARDIVLAARNATADLAALRTLASTHGTKLTVYPVDLCEQGAVQQLFMRLGEAHLPLAGIVHAAGQLADASFRQLDAEAFACAFDAKVGGAWLLDRLSRHCPLDFFLMISSIAATLGAPGQANYAAANTCLDALAHERLAAGLPALSLALGAVAGSGMASDERVAGQLLRKGILALDPVWLRSRCAQWFSETKPLAIVANFDWLRVRAQKDADGRARPMIEALLSAVQPASKVAVAVPISVPINPDSVDQMLRENITSILGLPDPTAIGSDETLNALGMDSIMLVELRDRVAQRLGIDFPMRLLFDFPQVDKLSQHLRKLLNTEDSADIDPMPTTNKSVAAAGQTDIAVVGIGCRFPGGANSPEEFWSMLVEGRDLIGEIDSLRWDAPQLMRDGALSTVRAGVLDHIDYFDCDLFGITPREAHCIEPQQRLLLEVGWEALERAGYDFAARGVVGGVFVGPGPNDYARRFPTGTSELSHHHSTGNALSVTAGRLAFTLDWRGPALAVDTACSSSLMAVHLAVLSLRRRECDIALAGGVNLLLSSETSVLLSKGKMLAPDGRCKSFDASANGYVRSEGCGIVVLKRLDDALASGDRILAIVRGSSSNQDGHSQGLTAPNGQAQQRVLRQALADAAVDPAQVELLEAHGTGTMLGDPIELAAAQAVYAQGTARQAPLWVSSVKTNMGHAEAAAGIAGFIKTVLCLQHELIPPHLHFTRLNPEIKIDPAQICIPTSAQPWSGDKRCAAVSSFGFSGTNVHMVLQAAPSAKSEEPEVRAEPLSSLRISAATPSALISYLWAYREMLVDLSQPNYQKLCIKSWRRAELGCTRIIEAATPAAAATALDAALAGLGATSNRIPHLAHAADGVPLYPFERQRFWLDVRPNLPAMSPRSARLGLRLSARQAPQVIFAVDYTGQPPFHLEDHLVHGEKVIPAAAHLALIFGMLADLRGNQGWQLTDVLCEEALVVSVDMETVRYQFNLLSVEQETAYRVEVLSDEGGRTRRHLRAEAHATGDQLEVAHIAASVEDPPLARIDGKAFYSRLYAPEVRLANAFCSIASIEQYVGHATAEVTWTSDTDGLIVPGELDSLLQTIALATLSDEPEHSHMTGATIPLSIDRLTLSPLRKEALHSGRAICNTRLVNEHADGTTFVHDLSLAEAGEMPFLSIEGLVTRQISEQQLKRVSVSPSYLVETWVERPAQERSNEEPVFVLLNAPQNLTSKSWRSKLVDTGVIDATTTDKSALLPLLNGRDVRLLYWLPAVAQDDVCAQLWMDQANALVAAARQAYRLALAMEGGTLGFCVVSECHAAVVKEAGSSPLYGFAKGLCKSLSLEWPECAVSMLDVDLLHSDLATLFGELRAMRSDYVAWRNGHRYVLRIEERPAPQATQAFACRADGFYLLTGGLGDLAIETGRWLAQRGAKRLLLVGRRALDGRMEQQLVELRATTGARVEYQSCDIADHEALSDLFAQSGADGSLRGIFHCAGLLADGLFSTLTDENFEQVMRAKVMGSWNLHQLSSQLELDCFVLYSSLAAMLGSKGQSNYAAANGFMDQLCAWRRQRGLAGLSINWSAWDGIGMAAKTAKSNSNGLQRLSPSQALAMLELALASGYSQLGVADIDWSIFAHQWHGELPPLVEDWLAQRSTQHAPHLVSGVDKIPATDAARELRQAPPALRQETAKRHVQLIARQIMGQNESNVLAEDKSFHELGFDSVMSIELKMKLQDSFSMRVPSTVMFDYPNVDSLAAWLVQTLAADEIQAEDRNKHNSPKLNAKPNDFDHLNEDQLAEVLDKLL